MLSTETRPALLLLVLCFGFSDVTTAAELKAHTAEAFQHYVQKTEARMQGELSDPEKFLYFESLPEEQKQAMLERLRSGQVIIEPMRTTEKGKAIEIPDGLVHHWLAIGFMPGATLDQALALAKDYPRHAELYAPDVQRSQVLSHDGEHFSVYYRFYRHAIVTAVYNTDFNVDYSLADPTHAYCFARAGRIAEVQNAGKPNEKELPVGNDHGYMWRLNLYTRYEEKDGGVYIEIEFLALSRTVPAVFAWLVNPYIRSIPREYLTHYVVTTGKALGAVSAPEPVGEKSGARSQGGVREVTAKR
jgi:hypothetical protein